MRPLFALPFALFAGLSPAMALEGDIPNGRRLAYEFCARCHDVGPGGAWKMHPPSFASIARFRPEEQIVARIWFPPLHGQMPQMFEMLRPEIVADLAAYILSLETDD